MSTSPLASLIDREASITQANPQIALASPLLQELVNKGTRIWGDASRSVAGTKNEHLSVMMLYLHMIEMTDGVEVLVAASCPVPAKPLVRSLFEGLLSIEYIFQRDYEQRSLTWLYFYLFNMLSSAEKNDPSTGAGKTHQKAIQNDKSLSRMSALDPTAIQQHQQELKQILAEQQFAQIDAEYTRVKAKSGRKPEWYQLFGGPSNLRNLAKHLDREGQYSLLYGHLSSVVHAQDITRYIRRSQQGQWIVRNFRAGDEIKEVTITGSKYFLDASKLIVKKFLPTEDLRSWIDSEVAPRQQELLFA